MLSLDRKFTFKGDPVQNFELTPREEQVLNLMTKGLQNKEIADILGVSLRTVEHHNTQVFRKLEVGDRVEAVLFILSSVTAHQNGASDG